MADLDFDELHKNITKQIDGEPEQSPYSERRKSTRRMADPASARRDSNRDEVAINVKVNKKPAVVAPPVVEQPAITPQPTADPKPVAPHQSAVPQSPVAVQQTVVHNPVSQQRVDVAETALSEAINHPEVQPEPVVTQFEKPGPVGAGSDEMANFDFHTEDNQNYVPPHEDQSMVELETDDLGPATNIHTQEQAAIQPAEPMSIPNTKTKETAYIQPPEPKSSIQTEGFGGVATGFDIDESTIPGQETDQHHKKSSSKLWDILYYILVVLLVIVIVSLVLVLLDRFEVINLPDNIPIVGLL